MKWYFNLTRPASDAQKQQDVKNILAACQHGDVQFPSVSVACLDLLYYDATDAEFARIETALRRGKW